MCFFALQVLGCCLARDSNTLVTACWDGIVRVWDVRSGSRAARQLTGHTEAVSGMICVDVWIVSVLCVLCEWWRLTSKVSDVCGFVVCVMCARACDCVVCGWIAGEVLCVHSLHDTCCVVL